MYSNDYVMKLSKLLIAAAWADGDLSIDEQNALKDLLFAFPELTDREWTILNMYMDTPVSIEESEALMCDLLDEITTEEDKDFVVSVFKNLFEADGVVTEEEEAMLEDIQVALAAKSTGIFAQLSSMIDKAVSKRNDHYREGAQREEMIEDYLRNRIYFKVKSILNTAGEDIAMPEDKLRKLCLAAGLMARVAWTDKKITEAEEQQIGDILKSDWGLNGVEAVLVTQLSISTVMHGIDNFRLSRTFFEHTTREERQGFLKTLFHIANSSEKTAHREIEEIRIIADTLHLKHSEFIDAKLSISDGDRNGM